MSEHRLSCLYSPCMCWMLPLNFLVFIEIGEGPGCSGKMVKSGSLAPVDIHQLVLAWPRANGYGRMKEWLSVFFFVVL
jgi:hypothetical protein